jgi:integrase
MSALREKMIEDMQLRGFAVRTQEAYLLAVSQLARHYHKSPDQIEEEELRQYFLFLKNEKHAARASCTSALCGIKFFFERTLGREWKTFEFLRPAKEKKLPVVLSVSEVGRVLGCVHRQSYRVCLTTIYACGLRLLEGAHLQVKDIDGERKLIHVRGGCILRWNGGGVWGCHVGFWRCIIVKVFLIIHQDGRNRDIITIFFPINHPPGVFSGLYASYKRFAWKICG